MIENGDIIKNREILIIKNNISKLEEQYFNNLKITKEELEAHLEGIEDYSDAYEECETQFTHLAMEEARKEEEAAEEE